MIDQRKSARRKTFYGARINVEALPGWSVDCTVKNIGRGGARIALPPSATIPDRFKLDIPSKTADAARLVWHRDGLIGIAFEAGQQDAEAVAPERVAETSTRLERRIAAIVNREAAIVIQFERRARRGFAARLGE